MSATSHDQTAVPGKLKQRVWDFCFERCGLEIAQHLAEKKTVPIHRCTPFYFLGGMALFLFMVQIVSGILLSLYYKPSAELAFESVRAIMTEVEFGWLIRSAHSWSANLLIGVLFLHLLTTYMMRAYRRPREITWITGVFLVGVAMAFGFSGYLLPWNQLSFFATRVGTAIAGVFPVVGHHLLLVARGGENVTGDTLARFYAGHVAILPLVTVILLGGHLFLIQQHGMSIPDSEATEKKGIPKTASMPFVPHFLLRDMVGWYLALALLAALAALFPWELGVKADPFGAAPPGIRPEWYFLFMFQTLKQLPGHIGPFEGEMLGVLFFTIAGIIVLLVPFLDRGPRSRRVLNVLVTLDVSFFVIMTAWGRYSAPGEVRLLIGLAALLTTVALALVLPFIPRGSSNDRTVRIVLVITAAIAIVAALWEFLHSRQAPETALAPIQQFIQDINVSIV